MVRVTATFVGIGSGTGPPRGEGWAPRVVISSTVFGIGAELHGTPSTRSPEFSVNPRPETLISTTYILNRQPQERWWCTSPLHYQQSRRPHLLPRVFFITLKPGDERYKSPKSETLNHTPSTLKSVSRAWGKDAGVPRLTGQSVPSLLLVQDLPGSVNSCRLVVIFSQQL